MTEADPTTAEQPSAEAGGLAQRPEVMVGVAFAGAFVLARILKRMFD